MPSWLVSTPPPYSVAVFPLMVPPSMVVSPWMQMAPPLLCALLFVKVQFVSVVAQSVQRAPPEDMVDSLFVNEQLVAVT